MGLAGAIAVCAIGRLDGIWILVLYAGIAIVARQTLAREQRTTIDRDKGMIGSHRVGLFGGPVGAEVADVAISEIEAIELKCHRYVLGVAFQIRARLRDGRAIPITGTTRRFQEGQVLASQINAFLGLPGVPRAVD